MKALFHKYFELSFWITSLVLLAFMDPKTDIHYSFCLFKFMGLKFCPGCGLGHSISFLFHGQLKNSFSAHPLGVFAVLIILFRIFRLTFLHHFKIKKHAYAT